MESVEGAKIRLAQPPAIEIRPEWAVGVSRAPSIQEVGIEGLTFEFPEAKYPGHLKEAGYNAIDLSAAISCWVRDVETVNADSGLFAGRCKHVTVDGFEARGRTMHHVLSASWSSDCLFTRWRIEAPHVHGTTISWAAHRNVFSNGWAKDLAMDAHRAAPFENLHTNIVIECGASLPSPFRSGGSAPRGPHAARGNVYWNVEVRAAEGNGALRVPPQPEWPLGVFVGWHGSRPLEFEAAKDRKQAVELLNEAPPIKDLHLHQRKKRLGR